MENPNSSELVINDGTDEKRKISFFEYLLMFILIIYAGRANTFVESVSITENPIGVLLPVLLAGILAVKWRVAFTKEFFILIVGFTIYFSAISIKYQEIQPTFFLTYVFRFFIVFAVIKALKKDFFRLYEVILYYLTIIALGFWFIQIVLGGDSLYYIFNNVPGVKTFSYVSSSGLNMILYSVQPSYVSVYNYSLIIRNCGFAWEPGGFAVYLCLAIFINLFILKPDERNKKRFWIFVIALLTTQSTTGYVIFAVIMMFHILNKDLSKMLLLLPVLVIGLIAFSSLPFMKNKIYEIISETRTIDQLIVRTIGRQENINPQRFTSFIISFRDFQKNPVLGMGAHSDDSWTVKLGAKISTISGIGNLLAQFGLSGFLFFILTTFYTSFRFSEYYNFKGKILFFTIVLFISVSYSIIFLTLVMCFWMFALFEKEENMKEIPEEIVAVTE
jgi:hypothetical protein